MRTWLYNILSTSPALDAIVGDRIWQNTAMQHVPEIKPFIIYRYAGKTEHLRGDDGVTAWRQPIQIFAHDKPGDYTRIENILAIVYGLLVPSTNPQVVWLEDSEDFRDDDFGTILQYSRYQLTYPA